MPRITTALVATTAVLAATVVATGGAFARPDTRSLTCAEAQDLVRRAGAITLSTGPNTYTRFVADQGFCVRMEIVQPEYVPTRDAGQCFIGFQCVPVTVRRTFP